MRKIAQALALASLLTATPLALAEDAAVSPASGAAMFSQILQSMCPALVEDLIKKPELAPLAQEKELSDKVCSCVIKRFKEDQRLQKAIDIDLPKLSEKMKSKKLETYFIARTTSAMCGCLSNEFDRILDSSKLLEE